MPEMLSAATGVVQADSRVSSRPGWRVESGHEFAVGGACCGEVFVAFGELQAQVDDLLLEPGDLLVESVDVGGGAEPGGVPGALAEGVGEVTFEVLDSAMEPGGAFVRGE